MILQHDSGITTRHKVKNRTLDKKPQKCWSSTATTGCSGVISSGLESKIEEYSINSICHACHKAQSVLLVLLGLLGLLDYTYTCCALFLEIGFLGRLP